MLKSTIVPAETAAPTILLIMKTVTKKKKQIKARQNQQLITQGRYRTECNETCHCATATHKTAKEFKWYF